MASYKRSRIGNASAYLSPACTFLGPNSWFVAVDGRFNFSHWSF